MQPPAERLPLLAELLGGYGWGGIAGVLPDRLLSGDPPGLLLPWLSVHLSGKQKRQAKRLTVGGPVLTCSDGRLARQLHGRQRQLDQGAHL